MQSYSFRFRNAQSLYVSQTNVQRRLIIRAAAAAEAASTPAVVKQQLLYDGIALDMVRDVAIAQLDAFPSVTGSGST